MNESVLRGFCQKCGWPIHYGIDNEKSSVCHSANFDSINTNSIVKGMFYHKIEPVWFLSSKQMRILWENYEFKKWMWENTLSVNETLAELLNKNPFLVARILKEAGEKK
jgi:hypothetical protein